MKLDRAEETFKAATDGIKKALSLAKDAGFADMRELLLDALERMLDLQDEVIEWRTENRRLKRQRDRRAEALFERGAFFEPDGREGPYCLLCMIFRGRAADPPRLERNNAKFSECPVCKGRFPLDVFVDEPTSTDGL